MKNVIALEPAYVERERKYAPQGRLDLHDVLTKVLADPLHYAPPPAELPISMPLEVTGLRTRIYFVDAYLGCMDDDIELRQEIRQKYGVKQTIKVGRPTAGADGTLQRVEHPARLRNFGIDISAVKEARLKRRLKTAYGAVPFKPVVRMQSQRTKLVYHPDGNPDCAIELGFDLVCVGTTFFGFSWQAPQLEMELIKGDISVLDAEEARLLKSFNLKHDTTSKPFAGLQRLRDELEMDGKIQRMFQEIPEKQLPAWGRVR